MPDILLSRGAEWRKWDLHVHTPDSIEERYRGVQDPWDRFLSELQALPPEFAVLGINDYWFLDGYKRVLQERASGRLANLERVFPVVEMRLDQFGGSGSRLSRANMHVIFDDTLGPELIEQQFLTAMVPRFRLDASIEGATWSGVVNRDALADLGASVKASVPESVRRDRGSDLKEGFSNLVVSLDSVQEALSKPYFRNRAVLALGKTEWADIAWTDGSIASKKHLINSVDLLFTAFDDASTWGRQRERLRDQGVPDCLIDCSDAHTWSDSSQKDRLGNCATWMRAATSFPGLLHALSEFNSRVIVGAEPPDLARRRRAPEKIIQSVQLLSAEAPVADLFDYTLPLNQGLVAIIGNKGQGKSALLDCIGRGGNSSRDEDFAFLNSTRFLARSNPLRDKFKVRLQWLDGTTREVGLHESYDRSSLERLEYLPQKLIERICSSDPHSAERGAFEEELTRVLFHHIRPEERAGQTNFQDLLVLQTNAVEVQLRDARSRLTGLCVGYVTLHTTAARLVLSDLLVLQEDLRAARNEAEQELESARARLNQVTQESGGTPELAADRARLDQVSIEITELEQENQQDSASAAALARRLSDVKAVETELETLVVRARALDDRLRDLLGRPAGAPPLAVLSVDTGALLAQESALEHSRIELIAAIRLREGRLTELGAFKSLLEARLASVDAARDAARREVEQLSSRASAINGAPDEPGTLLKLELEVAEAQALPERTAAARRALLDGAREVHGLLTRKLTVVEDLYRPAAHFVNSNELARDTGLAFVAGLEVGREWIRFQEELDSRKTGELVQYLEDQGTSLTPGSVDTVVDMLDEVLERLLHQRGSNTGAARFMGDSFRGYTDGSVFLADLLGLSWIQGRFSLTGGGQPLDQLSPGERGLVLLLFYLVVDREDTPLLLDQPEENLDNAAVRRVLVPAMCDARQRRQVIVVTHNANLAVVGDADQIVHCAHVDGRFRVEAGSLAHAAAGNYSIDVLEGARPAFDNRRLKYDRVVPPA